MSIEYKDYYQLLGVPKTATEKEIKSAFRKLARQYHPDMNPNDPKAEAKFKEINEAYEVLGDADKRKRYDSLGGNWRHGANFDPPPGFDGFNFNFGQGGQGGFSSFFDALFGQMGGQMGGQGFNQQAGYGDMFGDMFGGGGQRAYNQQQQINLDVEAPLELTLEELYRGQSKSVQINTPQGLKALNVSIPKGAKSGTKIKLKGQGKQAQGKVGDLLLVVKIRPHALFEVDERDLIATVTVKLPDLVLGCDLNAPTLEGPVSLKLPAGTEPGKKLRIKGKGLPGKTEADNGHLYIKIAVRVPKDPPDVVKKHYQALQQLEN